MSPSAAIEGGCLSASFAQLYERAWAVSDYLQLANPFTRIHITDMPLAGGIGDETFQRFAHLVDVLAERDVRLDVHSRAEGLPGPLAQAAA